MPGPSQLLAPDIARMAVIEQQLAALTPRLRELQARIEATRGPREAAMHRVYDLEHDEATEARLRAEFATADRAWQAAVDAWRAAEAPAFALREEWLQLQVIRSFMPPAQCARRWRARSIWSSAEAGRRLPSAWTASTAGPATTIAAAVALADVDGPGCARAGDSSAPGVRRDASRRPVSPRLLALRRSGR